MGGVRARKSRRNKIVNRTKVGKKRKSKVPVIQSTTIRDKWDAKRTVKQNLKSMGIAFDPNNPSMLHTKKRVGDKMQVDSEPTDVIKGFEKEAAMTSKSERHISPGEAQFIMSLAKDYGTDYKAMAKDKRNFMQHTPKQLGRKCEAFFKSSYHEKCTKDEAMDQDS
eukprot:gene5568-6256_t